MDNERVKKTVSNASNNIQTKWNELIKIDSKPS